MKPLIKAMKTQVYYIHTYTHTHTHIYIYIYMTKIEISSIENAMNFL